MIYTATYTSNLNLKLPEYTDAADVGDLNDNFKKIDDFSGGGKVEEWLSGIQEKADKALSDIQTEATESLAQVQERADEVLASIPEDYSAIDADVKNLKIYKAAAIPDTSALAASHEVYAQRDHPLNVRVHGYTYQEGEGDPSLENVRPISGLSAAQARAGGKNLFDMSKVLAKYLVGGKIVVNTIGYGADIYSGTTNGNVDMIEEVRENLILLPPGTYTLTFDAEFVESETYKSISVYKVARDNTVTRLIVADSGESFSVDDYTLITLRRTTNNAATFSNIQLELGDTATTYEPYCANVITPPLLPDNSPLMEGDTVENWVRSGCDKKIVLDGTQNVVLSSATTNYRWAFAVSNVSAPDSSLIYPVYSDRYTPNTATQNYYSNTCIAFASNWIYVYDKERSGFTKEEVMAYLAANPLTVYYRSTDYTPDKDLRVCRVTRRENLVVFDGTEKWTSGDAGSSTYFLYDSLKPSKVVGGFKNTRFKTINQVPSHGNSYIAGASKNMILCYVREESAADINAWKSLLADWHADGKPLAISYELATPEVYMADPLLLLPPAALESETVTVTGSGETEVEYAHETKHFIIDFVTKALASQS